MPALAVEIIRLADEHFPGFVECGFVDVLGNRHTFVEKVPVVTQSNLNVRSSYPQPGHVRCEIEAQWVDNTGKHLAQVSTRRPDGVQSTAGASSFVVLSAQVEMQGGA